MKYHIIDMANISARELKLVDRAFSLWKQIYSQELETRGLSLHIEDFWNCRLLAIIEDGFNVIGVHIYNVFDLRTLATSHKYFDDVTPERIEIMKSQKIERLMSMEYLMVNPAFRGAKSPIRWGEVVIGLGFKVMVHSPWDAIIGIARADKHVNDMGRKMGCAETDSVVKNQTPCKVMIMTKNEIKDHEDPQTQALIDSLWNQRSNSSPWYQEHNTKKKKAA